MIKLPKTRKGLTTRFEKSRFKVVNSLDIEYGWLLPGGFGVNTGMMDHREAAYYLELTTSHLFKAGWIRKANNYNYELDISKLKSVKELGTYLAHLMGTRNLQQSIFIEDYYGDTYNFTLEDFVRHDMNLRDILRLDRYKV